MAPSVNSKVRLSTVFSFPVKIFFFILNRLQGTSAYRAIGKNFRPHINIVEADKADMQKIYRWFTRGSVEAPIMQNPGVMNIVAKRKKRIIGYIQLVRRPEDSRFYPGYWLFSLKVKMFYRRMGIGSKLSLVVIQTALQEGARELQLRVKRDNLKAIKLYQKLGFHKRIPDHETSPGNRGFSNDQEIIMGKSLYNFP